MIEVTKVGAKFIRFKKVLVRGDSLFFCSTIAPIMPDKKNITAHIAVFSATQSIFADEKKGHQDNNRRPMPKEFSGMTQGIWAPCHCVVQGPGGTHLVGASGKMKTGALDGRRPIHWQFLTDTGCSTSSPGRYRPPRCCCAGYTTCICSGSNGRAGS